jgi:hypothetical protein
MATLITTHDRAASPARAQLAVTGETMQPAQAWLWLRPRDRRA